MSANVASIVELAQRLIKIPTQGGIDSSLELLQEVCRWCMAHDLWANILNSPENKPVAMLCRLGGSSEKPKYCLNACGDTAPIGDASSWKCPPTSAKIVDGWLYGRGWENAITEAESG